MKTATLTRKVTSDEGTFGTFKFWKLSYHSGELPWHLNKRGISCIAQGKYVCAFTWSPKFKKKTYELMHVTDRSDIRIHSANYFGDKASGYLSEVEGCIGLGKVITSSNKQACLLKSREAVSDMEHYFDGEDFELEFIEALSQVP